MKITDVRTHILRKAYDPEKYGASSKGWIRDRASLLVQVLTDMKVGFLHPHEDVRLVAAIRKVVGEDVRLMVDANHAYNASSAIEMARALAPYDIIQPDTCGSGGLTECKRIAALARAFGIQYSPHVWGSVVGLAASLHLLASLPPCPPTGNPSAYYQEPVLEFDRNPSPLRDELSRLPIEFRGGMVWVPQRPGLGIEIDQDVLGRYQVA